MAVADVLRKRIDIPLQKAMPQEDGSTLVRGKFTSDNRDEVGDLITRAATERALPRYKRWGNIRYMHQPKPVGKVTRIGVEDGLDWNEVEFRVIDPQAKFEVDHGLLQALSVGILVKLEDVDLMEDGGWIINDYQLAEISLVDHPANYDAALELNLSLDDALRARMREEGVVPVLRSIGATPVRKGEPMEDENKNPVEPVAADAAEQPVEQAQEVAPVAEVPAEEPEAAAEEAPVAEGDSAPVSEAEEVPAAVEEPVAEVAGESPLAELLSQLTMSITALTTKVDGLVAQRDTPAPEADVESEASPSEVAAKDISGEDNRVAQLEKALADLTAQVEALSTPVDRKGALPVEEAPEEGDNEEAPNVVQKPKSLEDAVGKYLAARSRR